MGQPSLSIDDWCEIGGTVAGLDIMPRAGKLVAKPKREAMATLQRRQLAAVHPGETAPELIANPDVARGLEQSLIHAVIECLRAPPTRKSTIARRHHAVIMTRFWEALENHVGEAIYLPELCAEIGVAERTLRQCCQRYLGVGPMRYLHLRRMHLACRALRERAATSVIDIATRFGFCELGRFAVAYRTLFGGTPSQTLHRGARRAA